MAGNTHCACGTPLVHFPGSGARRIYCDVCARQRKLEATRAHYDRNHVSEARKTCIDCGDPITQPPGKGRRRVRCPRCSRIWKKRYNREWHERLREEDRRLNAKG